MNKYIKCNLIIIILICLWAYIINQHCLIDWSSISAWTWNDSGKVLISLSVCVWDPQHLSSCSNTHLFTNMTCLRGTNCWKTKAFPPSTEHECSIRSQLYFQLAPIGVYNLTEFHKGCFKEPTNNTLIKLLCNITLNLQIMRIKEKKRSKMLLHY